VVQFEVPPIVPADPQANITDLLAERVKKTPQLALFAVPEGEGWRDVTATEFQRQVIALAKGFVAATVDEVCAAAGVTAFVQPGGSQRDAEVIAAADAAGAAMLLTGTRHFRH